VVEIPFARREYHSGQIRSPPGVLPGAGPSPAAARRALIDPAEFFRIPNLNLTDEDDPDDEISRIEVRLEELAEVAERCRKAILVSKAAVAGGAALLLVAIFGVFGSSAEVAIGSIALVLGGIVWLGSNVSTLRQTMAAISAAEALRSELIGRIDLRVVGDSNTKIN
jgi:hypothetical protein